MTQLTEADRDLLTELCDQPLVIAHYHQHPDLPALNDLMGRGLVTAVHYRHGGTIYGITWAGQQALKGQG